MVRDGNRLRGSTCLLCLLCLLCLVAPRYPEFSWHWGGIERVQAEVVVRAINIVTDQPSGHASDQDIRREVLFGKHTARAHGRCKAIDRSACNPTRIFISDYRRQGPCRSRVIRWE